MGKALRGGIVVGLAVLVAAIVYSGVYFSSGLAGMESGSLSIILVMAWALVVAVLLVVLWQRMLVREEYLRKFYLSGDTIFNFELGAAKRTRALASDRADDLVKYLAAAIAGLRYGNAPLDPPEGFRPEFCVSTSRYVNDGDWRGSLQRVQQREDGHRVYVDLASFSSAAELEAALQEFVFAA